MTQFLLFLGKYPRRLILPTIILLAIIIIPFSASWITSSNPVQIDVMHRLALPTWTHLLGQDEFGRDRLARILYGGQVSLTVAFVSATIASVIGVLFGLFGAFFRGPFEFVTRRLADIVLCFPPILLALLVVTLFGPGVPTLIAVLSVLYFPVFARIAFAEALSVTALEYVEASIVLGTPTRRILFGTILPNISGPLLVQYSLTVAAAITIESGLSFLGLGVVPPAPSWGQMIRGARSFMTQDPVGIFIPCAALTITILAINLFCDRLRDVLDPKGLAKKPRILPTLLGKVAYYERTLAAGTVAEVSDLELNLATPKGAPIKLIEGVSLELKEGSCTALVGESGSGKSLSSLALMGLLPEIIAPSKGTMSLKRKSGDVISLESAPERELQGIRGEEVAMIFQDPMTALNPVRKIGDQLTEAILAHRSVSKQEARKRAIHLLEVVGVNEAERRFNGYPHEMSGGMRQRVMIAMALTCEPKLLIADEPTTALDVTIQAEIIDLLRRLQTEYANGLSMLFISHNLGIVSEIADRVVVMYSGQIIEDGPAEQVLHHPRHPYTKALITSMPSSHGDCHSSRGDRLDMISGTPPLPAHRPSGCAFRDRCPLSVNRCGEAQPEFVNFSDEDRKVKCIRAQEVAA